MGEFTPSELALPKSKIEMPKIVTAAMAIGSVALPSAAIADGFTGHAKEAPEPKSMPPAMPPTLSPYNRGVRNRLVTVRHHRHPQPKYNFTGYSVAGPTSTFGPPAEGAGRTADAGTDDRPCIAIRDDSTLGHNFLVKVLYQRIWHETVLPHCDWGPASSTGRNIDITGKGVEMLHLNPYSYPTGAWGVAREIATPTRQPDPGAKLSFPGHAVITFGDN